MTEEQVKAALIGTAFENRPIAMLSNHRGPNVSRSVTKPHIRVVIFADGLQANIPWAV